jgi:hypothetical protein
LSPDRRHAPWLKFARDALSVPAGYSKEDLLAFREIAYLEHHALVPVIEVYLRLAQRSETEVEPKIPRVVKRGKSLHLFDLLREKKFFPHNLDLARFATRVLPELRANRFGKMSRSEIAAKMIEYLESRDPRTRQALEESMREALATLGARPPKDVERRSFLSKWEKIIKGAESPNG